MITPENNADKSNETFGDSITGKFNAIKQFVEATQNETAPEVDKKKSILKKILKNKS